MVRQTQNQTTDTETNRKLQRGRTDNKTDRETDVTRRCEVETKRIPLLEDVETIFMSGMAVKFMSMK